MLGKTFHAPYRRRADALVDVCPTAIVCDTVTHLANPAFAMTTRLLPLILSGGAGTRLWPLSREAAPKPFMPLPDGETLLAKTAARAWALDGVDALLTVTNRDYYFHTKDTYAAAGAPQAASSSEAVTTMGSTPCRDFLNMNRLPIKCCASFIRERKAESSRVG